MSYTPDCADCPTPAECKAANDCKVLRQIRHGAASGSPSAELGTLTKPAQVGNTIFHAGIAERTVIERAQREYEYQQTPEKEAARLKRVHAFVASLDTPPLPESITDRPLDCSADSGSRSATLATWAEAEKARADAYEAAARICEEMSYPPEGRDRWANKEEEWAAIKLEDAAKSIRERKAKVCHVTQAATGHGGANG